MQCSCTNLADYYREKMNLFLQETYFLDFSSPEIQELVSDLKYLRASQKVKAKALYLKVRDGFRYNPYKISLHEKEYRASYFATQKENHCIGKSVILMAGLRALGIPCKLVLAKVTNHMAVEILTEKLGTNEIAPHGYVSACIDDKWVKCSPAFNKELCELQNLDPLEFNGEEDSIFQEFNKNGKAFMEYHEVYGEYDDVPLDKIQNIFREHYPQLEKHFMGGRLDINSLNQKP